MALSVNVTEASSTVSDVHPNAAYYDFMESSSGGDDFNATYMDYDFVEGSGYAIVHRFQTVCVPIFFVLGLLGNLLALGCFLSQPLRAASCCLYMAAKCLSDTTFLGVVWVIWLNRVGVGALNTQGVCQVTIFLSYVSGFTSVWLVVAVTSENYLRLCRPHLAHSHCTPRVALLAIAVIVAVSLIVYSFALWTNTVLGGSGGGGGGGVEGDGGELDEAAATATAPPPPPPLCMAMIKFKDVLMVMTFVDTALTLVLPSVVMVPLVLATLVAGGKSVERRGRLTQRSSLRDVTARRGDVTTTTPKPKRSSSTTSSLEVKVARFLLAVSLTFLLLHTPGHLIRLKLLVHRYILHREFSPLDATLQRLFETLYYFNFCCSIVIFLASGSNFRSLFLAKYCCRLRFAACRSSPSSPSLSSATTATTMTNMDETAMKTMGKGRRRRRRRGGEGRRGEGGGGGRLVTSLVDTDSVRTTLSSVDAPV